MGARMRDVIFGHLDQLRYEPTAKRVRVTVRSAAPSAGAETEPSEGGDHVTVVDTTRALLVWEPRRVVPSYAVPFDDLAATVEPAGPAGPTPAMPILHPGVPFAAHSTPGQALNLRVGDRVLDAAGFQPDDPDLAGYLLLDFRAFGAWYEEDTPLVSHPRDPYHRIDIRASSRVVRVEYAGRVLAESAHPTLLFETSLPVRYYLPRADVREQLTLGDRRTACAYKGAATHWSVPERDNIAWTYPDPLADATEIKDLVAFYDEMVDVYVDGVHRPPPDTPAGRAIRAEFVDG